MGVIDFSNDEIDTEGADKESQEILGNLVIRALLTPRAQEDYANTNIVYDQGNEFFDDKLTESINKSYTREDAMLLLGLSSGTRRRTNSIPDGESFVKSHVESLNRNNSTRTR